MRPDLALLLLRLVGLGLAVVHGWGKVHSLATGHGGSFVESVASLGFPAPVAFAWAAALAEFAGALCVALGLATRFAAAFAAFEMAVAAFLRHHAHLVLLAGLGVRPVPEETLKAWGDPEKALLYLVVFLALVFTGAGRLSLDALLTRKKGR
jgi:putative oxidoreductase